MIASVLHCQLPKKVYIFWKITWMYDLFHSVVIGMIEAFWSVCIKSVELFYNSEVTAQVLKWAFVFVSATCFAWIIWCACEGRWGYSYWWSSHKWRCWPCNWDSKFPGTVLCVLVNILLTLWEIFRLHSFFSVAAYAVCSNF